MSLRPDSGVAFVSKVGNARCERNAIYPHAHERVLARLARKLRVACFIPLLCVHHNVPSFKWVHGFDRDGGVAANRR